MQIQTIIYRQPRGYLVMLHDGRVVKARNQIEAKEIVAAEDRHLAGGTRVVINKVIWRGISRLVKGVR